MREGQISEWSLVMVAVGISMFIYFRRKKWLWKSWRTKSGGL